MGLVDFCQALVVYKQKMFKTSQETEAIQA